MNSIFGRLGFYSKAWINIKARRTKLDYMPEYVALEVTNVCNFKCVSCPQSDPLHHYKVPKTFISEEDCRLYLEKIRAAGILTNLIHWTLDGEPFMHKDFSRLATISADFGFTNAFFASNGRLCTVKRLLEFPLDRIQLNITIDFCSDRNYFEETRGPSGSWARVRENISSIINDDRLDSVRIVITDISSFSIHEPEELKRRFRNLQELFKISDRLTFRTRTYHNWTGFLKKRAEGRYHVCPYPWTHLRIASNGDIVPCCRDLQHKTVLGNLKEQSVEDVWNGRDMITLRGNLLNKQPEAIAACRECDLPRDGSKFTLKNLYLTMRDRVQLFAK